MLIGKQTPLNDTLQEVLGLFVPGAKRISPEEFLASDIGAFVSHPVIFVNLTDLTNEESRILSKAKELSGGPKIIGLHTFMVPEMRADILKRGFDGYLSFFEFSEEVESLLDALGVQNN